MMQNILVKPFKTPFDTAPFSKIKNAHFLPAFKLAIQEAKKEIDTIVNNSDNPTFQNTIEALDFSGEQLDRVSNIFFNLNSAETNDEREYYLAHADSLIINWDAKVLPANLRAQINNMRSRYSRAQSR